MATPGPTKVSKGLPGPPVQPPRPSIPFLPAQTRLTSENTFLTIVQKPENHVARDCEKKSQNKNRTSNGKRKKKFVDKDPCLEHPPVLRLDHARNSRLIVSPYLYVQAELYRIDDAGEMTFAPCLGTTVSSMYTCKDADDKEKKANYFVFPSMIPVFEKNRPGRYAIEFTLMDMHFSGSMRDDHLCATIITSTTSDPFQINFKPKASNALESSPLTRHLAENGVKLRLRSSPKPRGNCSKNDWSNSSVSLTASGGPKRRNMSNSRDIESLLTVGAFNSMAQPPAAPMPPYSNHYNATPNGGLFPNANGNQFAGAHEGVAYAKPAQFAGAHGGFAGANGAQFANGHGGAAYANGGYPAGGHGGFANTNEHHLVGGYGGFAGANGAYPAGAHAGVPTANVGYDLAANGGHIDNNVGCDAGGNCGLNNAIGGCCAGGIGSNLATMNGMYHAPADASMLGLPHPGQVF